MMKNSKNKTEIKMGALIGMVACTCFVIGMIFTAFVWNSYDDWTIENLKSDVTELENELSNIKLDKEANEDMYSAQITSLENELEYLNVCEVTFDEYEEKINESIITAVNTSKFMLETMFEDPQCVQYLRKEYQENPEFRDAIYNYELSIVELDELEEKGYIEG